MLTRSLRHFLLSTEECAIVLHSSKRQKRAVLSQFQISLNSYSARISCNSALICEISLISALPAFLLILNVCKLFLCLKLFNHPPDAENPLISNDVANSFAFSRIIGPLRIKFLEIC